MPVVAGPARSNARDMQHILILMSDTGGGHRASAQALKAGFDERYPRRFHIDIIDLLSDYLAWPLNQVPKAYPFLSNDAPWLWKLLYGGGGHRLSRVLARLGGRMSVKRVGACFDAFQPDLIISVHPLMQHVSMLALARLARRIPYVTVVTDLSTCHPLWFHPAVDATYVASDHSCALARQAGLDASRLHLFGLPIRPAFARPTRARPELRRSLEMDQELPAVLLVGGGEGVGPVEEIATQVALRLANGGAPVGQLVVICGRNKAMRERLAARRWPVPAFINGFVDNMPEWMAACDCIVTKAGPGTIAEALISGLPIILSGFIPGQEEGNVPYVLDNGVGEYCADPAGIAAIVARWFGEERAHLDAMAAKARAMGHPQATFQIVDSIVALLEAE